MTYRVNNFISAQANVDHSRCVGLHALRGDGVSRLEVRGQ